MDVDLVSAPHQLFGLVLEDDLPPADAGGVEVRVEADAHGVGRTYPGSVRTGCRRAALAEWGAGRAPWRAGGGEGHLLRSAATLGQPGAGVALVAGGGRSRRAVSASWVRCSAARSSESSLPVRMSAQPEGLGVC